MLSASGKLHIIFINLSLGCLQPCSLQVTEASWGNNKLQPWAEASKQELPSVKQLAARMPQMQAVI